MRTACATASTIHSYVVSRRDPGRCRRCLSALRLAVVTDFCSTGRVGRHTFRDRHILGRMWQTLLAHHLCDLSWAGRRMGRLRDNDECHVSGIFA